MKRNLILAQSEVMGNIQRCCGGVVHLFLPDGISLRFTEEAFLGFASLVKEASFQLIDESLRALLDDTKL